MKGLYITFSFLLAINAILFAQRAVYWACKWFEGKNILKDMRPSNERYALIKRKLTNAKIHTVCWIAIDFMALYAFFDCVMQIFRG